MKNRKNKKHLYPKFGYNRAEVIKQHNKFLSRDALPMRWRIFCERYCNIINPYNGLHAYTYICRGQAGEEFITLERWYTRPRSWRKTKLAQITKKVVSLTIKNGILDMLIDMQQYEIENFGKIDPAIYEKAQRLRENILNQYRKHGTTLQSK